MKEALDWCLACKGCRSDCPTHTDMAAYKAEFLSHYYETHRRPRQAWSMGRIGEWAPLASRFSGVVNLLSSPRVLQSAWPVSHRTEPLPKFARARFRSQFKPNGSGEPSCCSTTRSTTTSARRPRARRRSCSQRRAARSSCRREHVCCGRPYYDYGMLDEAKRALERVLEVARRADRAGRGARARLPLGVPRRAAPAPARRSARAQAARAGRSAWRVPAEEELHRQRADGSVLMHSHCHQKALWGTTSRRRRC